MKTVCEFVTAPESEGLFEMVNLSPKRTGLPFVVWISQKPVFRTMGGKEPIFELH